MAHRVPRDWVTPNASRQSVPSALSSATAAAPTRWWTARSRLPAEASISVWGLRGEGRSSRHSSEAGVSIVTAASPSARRLRGSLHESSGPQSQTNHRRQTYLGISGDTRWTSRCPHPSHHRCVSGKGMENIFAPCPPNLGWTSGGIIRAVRRCVLLVGVLHGWDGETSSGARSGR